MYFVLKILVILNEHEMKIIFYSAISCDPLLPADSFLNVRCPTGYTYGSTCFFSCFMTYVVKGAKSVTCELDETGLHGRWAWPNDIETFCERLSKFFFVNIFLIQ